MNIQLAKTQQNIIQLSAVAKQARLYVSGWVMRTIYMDWCSCPDMIMSNDRLAVAYDNSIPIGASTFMIQGSEVMVYVRPAWRRRGIGTQLIKLVTEHVDNFSYGLGIRDSNRFWITITDQPPNI